MKSRSYKSHSKFLNLTVKNNFWLFCAKYFCLKNQGISFNFTYYQSFHARITPFNIKIAHGFVKTNSYKEEEEFAKVCKATIE